METIPFSYAYAYVAPSLHCLCLCLCLSRNVNQALTTRDVGRTREEFVNAFT